MNDHPRMDPPSGDGQSDARLSELISAAADHAEPGEGLTAIRSRTRKESHMSSSRNWLYAVGGAVAGTAAVIVAIAVVSQVNGDDNSSTPVSSPTQGSHHSQHPTPTQSATGTPTDTASDSTATPTAAPIEGAVPVYYAGEGPKGTVLFREFQPGIGADPVAQAASAAVSGRPSDPDYRTLWPAGTQATASYDGNVVTVDLSGPALHDRPSGMSKNDAALALQQVIYSVQGAAQARAGVQFLLDGQHSDQVLGEAASEPLSQAPALQTLSLMSITSPAEGQVVSGEFKATGVNNSFEATAAYEIRDSGGKVVASGSGMAAGWGEDKLFPWSIKVDVSGLAPGSYTFVAMNDDPSGGAEGHGPDVDTRTIVVQ